MNQVDYVWRDLQVFLNGKLLVRITDFKGKRSQEVEEVGGAGSDPLALARGNRKFEGSITLYKREIDIMNASAREAGEDNLMDIDWEIVEHYKPTKDLPRQTTTWYPVVILEYETGMENNAKSKPVVLPFKSLRPKEK